MIICGQPEIRHYWPRGPGPAAAIESWDKLTVALSSHLLGVRTVSLQVELRLETASLSAAADSDGDPAGVPPSEEIIVCQVEVPSRIFTVPQAVTVDSSQGDNTDKSQEPITRTDQAQEMDRPPGPASESIESCHRVTRITRHTRIADGKRCAFPASISLKQARHVRQLGRSCVTVFFNRNVSSSLENKNRNGGLHSLFPRACVEVT
jgi:hypothetical protein